jgi:flagellar biosynthesis/type III secretory pathway protein FliH
MTILKAADVRARAVEVDTARASHEAMTAQLRAARDEGYRSGFADGHARALAEGADAGPRIAAALDELARNAAQVHAHAVEATSGALLDAAVQIAEWLVREHLATAPRAVLSRLEEISRSLVISEPCTIAVSSSDLAAVHDWAQAHGSLDVCVDSSLEPGEVRMTTRTGRAESLVTDALARAREVIESS